MMYWMAMVDLHAFVGATVSVARWLYTQSMLKAFTKKTPLKRPMARDSAAFLRSKTQNLVQLSSQPLQPFLQITISLLNDVSQIYELLATTGEQLQTP